ncbi:DUF1922 domain-containing protein [Candidatus Hecatella orcuttiae]|uniref:DUF1922 domain-containing protein n=1 Tax=Candidatus Hecatella orcuttiae TaxID=1935119 RepID=UPI0028683914|nr:DUF1922 domain-containing protein [Candidatus Hecatella orcuttiae]
MGKTRYLIFPCVACGRPAICREGQKIKVCPFCGAKTKLAGVRCLGRASSPREAKELISRLKLQASPRKGERRRV